ncbi:tetraacyldisaccharide 4'-kinase [Caldichromatium japonicum]|uniref:Tetraacyldisaccharide 4'-kinase n=2 Tax=Caldichromatium japonicum TaxID=2699430 RepID=A0A6G7VH51_9GAMM|nr:tetraacyldisaccharide 4'-kinase [Caldichromatium japonicum]QIK39117.1 tetraacyldisaccharide 4'-kinase [Caldichromatium japonicum]
MRLVDGLWYGRHPLIWPLMPLSWGYTAIARLRRFAYRRGWFEVQRLPVPVIVVGNLTVGGTGKTPLVLWIVERLKALGVRPVIIARGYGGRARDWPQVVGPDSDPFEFGDEPVLLAQRSGCLVVAGPDRVAAAWLALQLGDGDVLVSDDGLQHYRLGRDLEIALIDGKRGLGNGRCLPAGPLREPPERLKDIDWVIYKGGTGPDCRMRLEAGELINLLDPIRRSDLSALRGRRVRAVAGIGNPEAFFAQLTAAGMIIESWPYPDHYPFSAADGRRWQGLPVIMTEKDAVKCRPFAHPDWWALPVNAVLDPDCEQGLLAQLRALLHR